MTTEKAREANPRHKQTLGWEAFRVGFHKDTKKFKKNNMTREEAIKELRGFLGQLTEGCQEAIKVLIPELKESEDEKMIRVIRLALTDVPEERFTTEGTSLSKVLAYLEKQKINTEGDFGRGYDCGYKACLNSHGAEFFEKQKEQKPVDLEKEIKKHTDLFQADIEYPLRLTAIKFYELGLKARKEE